MPVKRRHAAAEHVCRGFGAAFVAGLYPAAIGGPVALGGKACCRTAAEETYLFGGGANRYRRGGGGGHYAVNLHVNVLGRTAEVFRVVDRGVEGGRARLYVFGGEGG